MSEASGVGRILDRFLRTPARGDTRAAQGCSLPQGYAAGLTGSGCLPLQPAEPPLLVHTDSLCILTNRFTMWAVFLLSSRHHLMLLPDWSARVCGWGEFSLFFPGEFSLFFPGFIKNGLNITILFFIWVKYHNTALKYFKITVNKLQ